MSENKKTLKQRIVNLLQSTNREGIGNIVNYLSTNDFFTAPASTKFHLSRKGGLSIHSYGVYKNFKKINKEEELGLKEDTVILCSILHDVCKINTYYPNILTKGNQSTKVPFKYSDKKPMGHGEKSVMILLTQGLRLTDKEQMIIRWHMGPFDYAFKQYQNDIKLYAKESQYLFIADYLASLGEK